MFLLDPECVGCEDFIFKLQISKIYFIHNYSNFEIGELSDVLF